MKPHTRTIGIRPSKEMMVSSSKPHVQNFKCVRFEYFPEISPGQIVDAVIMPVAPHAAVIPGKYYHVGK